MKHITRHTVKATALLLTFVMLFALFPAPTAEAAHTCVFNSAARYEAYHPHREFKNCSCGAYQYTGRSKAIWDTPAYSSTHPHNGTQNCIVYASCTYSRTTTYPGTKFNGCNDGTCHTHSFGSAANFEQQHPHRIYQTCLTSGCSGIQYTGTNRAANWGAATYNSTHPHTGTQKCTITSTCSTTQAVTYTGKYSGCSTCYPHTHAFSATVYYETAHPHRGYKTCACGVTQLTGSNKAESWTIGSVSATHSQHNRVDKCSAVSGCTTTRTVATNYSSSCGSCNPAPTPAPSPVIPSVTLSSPSGSYTVGSTITLSGTANMTCYRLAGSYIFNSVEHWTWQTVKLNTNSYSASFTPTQPGTYTFTLYARSYEESDPRTGQGSRSVTVTVVKDNTVAVEKVTIYAVGTNNVLKVGETVTAEYGITPTNATNKTVSWLSSNTSVATIDPSTGKITGNAAGTTRITATASNGKADSFTLTVVAASVSLVTGVPDNLAVGTISYDINTASGTGNVSWKATGGISIVSSNATSCKIKGISAIPSTLEVTESSSGQKTIYDVNVVPVTSVSFKYPTYTLKCDEQRNIEVIIAPAGQYIVDYDDFSWIVERPEILDVYGGVVTFGGRSPGVTTLTCRAKSNPSIQAVCTVQVTMQRPILNVSISTNLRAAPGGNVLLSLKKNAILVADTTASMEREVYNGVMYDWIKVKAFDTDNNSKHYDGWVALNNVENVWDIIDSPNVYMNNGELTQQQMMANARYIYDELLDAGWSKNAIYGILGNMETESNIDPSAWQVTNNKQYGFGLTQWTAENDRFYITWAEGQGLPIDDINVQLLRIKTEVSTNIDTAWIKSKHIANMSFYDFTQSNEKPEYLAEVFSKCYERNGGDPTERKNQALKWKYILEAIEIHNINL